MSGEAFSVNLSANLRPLGGDEIEVKYVTLGHYPVVLMHFDADADNALGVEVDATGFTPIELAEMFEMLAKCLHESQKLATEGEAE